MMIHLLLRSLIPHAALADNGCFTVGGPGAWGGVPSYISGSVRPRRRQAAITVLRSRQAMVIGPTPPGTGVIAAAMPCA
jgi:hypothetical protein